MDRTCDNNWKKNTWLCSEMYLLNNKIGFNFTPLGTVLNPSKSYDLTHDLSAVSAKTILKPTYKNAKVSSLVLFPSI